MQYVDRHAFEPDVSFDGGDMDCGSGLLLLIRRHMDPLRAGGLLEIRSTESSVEEDLPAWCRMTKNELLSCIRTNLELTDAAKLLKNDPHTLRGKMRKLKLDESYLRD